MSNYKNFLPKKALQVIFRWPNLAFTSKRRPTKGKIEKKMWTQVLGKLNYSCLFPFKISRSAVSLVI
jgi:hypothetical protein